MLFSTLSLHIHSSLNSQSTQFIHSTDITEGVLCARHRVVYWGYQGELNGITLVLNEIKRNLY